MIFKANLEILPLEQQILWKHLSQLKNMGYCLYGGTALALRFGHRLSVDFDFFSSLPLDKRELFQRFPLLQNSQVLQESPNSFIALVIPPEGTEQVKISFFGNIGFGRVGTPELSDDGIILVASIKDLMATKLKALFDRIELKDYLDISEMIQSGIRLTDGICDALALFPTFSPIHCLKTLCYFDLEELSCLSEVHKQVLEQSVSAIPLEQEFHPSPLISPSLVLSQTEFAEEMKRVQLRTKSRSMDDDLSL